MGSLTFLLFSTWSRCESFVKNLVGMSRHQCSISMYHFAPKILVCKDQAHIRDYNRARRASASKVLYLGRTKNCVLDDPCQTLKLQPRGCRSNTTPKTCQ
ncbi:hypothetical protein BC835DRAFT_153760 [Cytidiella melzeri]|nr:hypothetical protein BC835DRAFT_153760 [Cytidiella melzeri]